MEVLAKAAVAEIHRSVDDRCAVLRLEVDPDHEAELFLIKEEFAEEDKRLSGADQSPCFNGFAERYLSPGVGPAFLPDGYNEDEAELGVKREEEEEDEEEELDEEELDEEELDEEELDEEELEEEEPDENAAPLLDSTEAVDRPPWSPSDPRGGDAIEPSFPRGERQSEPPPFGFPPRCGPRPEDAAAPQAHALGRSHAASVAAARARRRARALLGCRRPPPDAGHGAPSHINAADQAPPPHPTQLHYRDPNAENPAAAAASSFLVRGGGGGLFGGGGVFGLARRMRTPWRSGVGEKRFNCTFCDKGFARFSQLKEHLRSHTGEKPFSCLQCGRSFTKQCNLIRHAVVHSGEKPYACALCGKCFTQRSSLKSHQKTAH
ncbi:Zinc finger protein 182 [Liparis tanakae]|uniref:Zinc finger protein 182 n=1 Tax=Liparis tanakae TaxID=230148 RepID=A0A4Z2FCN3_9TELE|nr:Zinc finger protein 182 [Liparis tanakae]